jgi:hypothetical protein
VWIAVVVIARVWGASSLGNGHRVNLRAAPLYGAWDVLLTVRVVPAVVLGAAIVRFGPSLATRLSWRRLLAMSAATTATWAVALAYVDGRSALTRPLLSRHEYLPFARGVDHLGGFLRDYAEQLPTRPIHVQGHPPGMVVLLALLDRVGLGGAGWVAALVIAGGGLATAATLVTARSVAGESTARAATPYVVALPAAIWIASTADALYAGVGLAGVALLAIAADRRRDVAAVAGGMLLGLGAHLTYGMALLGPLAIAVVARHRRVRPLVLGALGAAAVTAVFVGFGFWWADGLAATHRQYVAGVASARPYGYFFVGNLGALALAAGPAAAAGVASLRGRLWWAVGAVVIAVAVADIGGLSKGEVERIWLLFVPPLALAIPRTRAWLTAQVVAAIVLVTILRSPW